MPMSEEEPLPDLPPLPSWSVAAGDAERIANQVFEAIRQGVEDHNRATEARFPRDAHHYLSPEPSPGAVDSIARLLAADGPVRADTRLKGVPAYVYVEDQVTDAIRRHEYPAATAIQVMAALGWLSFDPDWNGPQSQPWAKAIDELHARTGGPDLLTVQRMFDATGVNGRALLWSSYSASSSLWWMLRLGRDWPDEDVWPFVAHNLDWILKESASRDGWRFDKHAHFAALATLPRPPARLRDHLYAMAVGSRKTVRLPAQAALERDPQRTTRVTAVLRDGKTDVRLAAAQWLTRVADPAALPALRAAWKKEKQDVVRGALLDALIAVGEDAGTYLDSATTAATAAKAVAKGVPAVIAWMNWETVPTVTWASSGETVPLTVVQWLCLTAVKTKSPEPDAVLRHYAALFDIAGRERLAARLLEAWRAEDLRRLTPAEAQARAARDAAATYDFHSSEYGDFEGMSLAQVTEALVRRRYLNALAGSAGSSKGLLAVVAACGGRDVVPLVERYLKEWYGYRAAQCKTLLTMLAWVEHPSATQLLLAVGSRFRTKSIQEEAIRQAGALAERKGWTAGELADRTIPTAGFEENGVLELPYGPRTFTAVLRPGLAVELRATAR